MNQILQDECLRGGARWRGASPSGKAQAQAATRGGAAEASPSLEGGRGCSGSGRDRQLPHVTQSASLTPGCPSVLRSLQLKG